MWQGTAPAHVPAIMDGISLELWIDAALSLILLLAAGGAGIALERIVVLTARSGGNRRDFIERVLALGREGRIDEAIAECVARPAAVSDVGLAVLRSRSRDEEELTGIARAATLLVRPRLLRRLALIRTVAVLAVLIGLVGTLGALRSALMEPSAEPLPAGIGRSLGPLITGILVAAPMIAVHAALSNRAVIVGQRVEEFGVRLVHSLVDRPDVRLGHR